MAAAVSFIHLSSMPMSVKYPLSVPDAAPRAAPASGIKKIRPISEPQKAPVTAPAAVVLTSWFSLIVLCCPSRRPRHHRARSNTLSAWPAIFDELLPPWPRLGTQSRQDHSSAPLLFERENPPQIDRLWGYFCANRSLRLCENGTLTGCPFRVCA